MANHKVDIYNIGDTVLCYIHITITFRNIIVIKFEFSQCENVKELAFGSIR